MHVALRARPIPSILRDYRGLLEASLEGFLRGFELLGSFFPIRGKYFSLEPVDPIRKGERPAQDGAEGCIEMTVTKVADGMERARRSCNMSLLRVCALTKANGRGVADHSRCTILAPSLWQQS